MSKLMLFGCCLLFVVAILVNDCDSFPYQTLDRKEGYIPVYIRVGDMPLIEINQELAMAFHEEPVNGRQLKSNDEYVASPQEVKPAEIEKKVDQITADHIEPQPIEHNV